MNEDLESRFEMMRREVDALQIAITGQSKPWYKNVSTLLSIIALLFSFGTTYVSDRRIAAQDIQSTRQELRGLLQRLVALPKENVDAKTKYQGDAASGALVSSFINQENSLLARNASELARKLPAKSVSATEYYAIAVALQNSYDLTGAQEFLNYSINASPDFNTEIAALRMLAAMRFIQSSPEAGRVEYQKALNIFSKYPQYDPFTKTSTNVWTELSWAFSEANNNSFSIASQHIENAEGLLATLPNSPGVNMLRAQVSQARTQVSSGKPPINPATASQLNVSPPSSPKR
jgi:tetratricopeptide (TPR) repeat protein